MFFFVLLICLSKFTRSTHPLLESELMAPRTTENYQMERKSSYKRVKRKQLQEKLDTTF